MIVVKRYLLFILTLLGSSTSAMPIYENQCKAVQNPDYYVHAVLKGIVKQMVFPGPPHFLSVEDGDWAEPRTILEVDEESLLGLVEAQSRVTPDHYLGEFIDPELKADEPNANLVTLDSSFKGELDHIELYENKLVTIDAIISAQPTRCHTPFVVEIVEVLYHEQ
jgi:hypothetical protein